MPTLKIMQRVMVLVVMAMTAAACTEPTWGGDEARHFTADAGEFPAMADAWSTRVREAITTWNARLGAAHCAPAFLIGPGFPAQLMTPDEWRDAALPGVFDGAAEPGMGIVFRVDNGGDVPELALVEHELGHALGLEHEPQDGPASIMTPHYGPAITDADIARVAALRGCL